MVAQPEQTNPMSGRRAIGALVGLAVGAVLTPVALYMAVISAGAGHGDYALAKILYPFSMLLTKVTDDTISMPSVIVAMIQFPVYGVALGLCKTKNSFLTIAGLLFAWHTIAIGTCFSGAIPGFSK